MNWEDFRTGKVMNTRDFEVRRIVSTGSSIEFIDMMDPQSRSVIVYIFSHQSIISGNHTVLDQFLKLDFATTGRDRVVIFTDRGAMYVLCNA